MQLDLKRPFGPPLYEAGSRAGVADSVMERRTAEERALSGVLSELKILLGWLKALYNVDLPIPDLPLASLKGFLAEPLTPGSTHPWVRLVAPLKLRDRLSVLGSLFLFRKRFPVLISPSIGHYMAKMSEDQGPPADGFIAFCSQELNKMFPFGWDRSWSAKVRGTTLSPSSCLESSRKRGGNLGVLARQEWLDRKMFCDHLTDRYSRWHPNVSRVKLVVAKTDGKDRIVSKNSVDASVLNPYHTLLYDHLTRFDWCLRGDARASKFVDFVSMKGEVFVSGDYESATDNLNLSVARHILGFVGRRCWKVPLFVREAACRTLECELTADGHETVRVKRGQLMGNFMSFPLLCLQNYLAFRFLVRREVPVRINGDDIVFRATPKEAKAWSDGVVDCGLTLSKGKTVVSSSWFSLNSTFFTAGRVHVKQAPVIRSTAWFKGLDDLTSLSGRWDTLKCFGGDKRRYLQIQFLRRYEDQVWFSQRSLRRGWGWSISETVLRQSRLIAREWFYSSLPAESDSPLPRVIKGYFKTSIPEGWRKVWSSGSDDPRFGEELVAHCWDPQIAQSASEAVDWKQGTFRYVHSPLSRFRAKLLGVNLKGLRTYLRGCRVLLDTRRGAGRWVWRKECGDASSAIRFIAAR